MAFIQNFFDRIIPVVKADEGDDDELVDPQKVLRETCSQQKKCRELQDRLTTCNDRVNSRKNTEETCMEELVDLVQCVDHCVSKTLFSKLK
ncbi:cytochrome b-c1 complex subunit 6, mitochondrial-like [Leptopilina boulardi]|uniref:cytochrome b-c1 complex subunit 6, mitochondrial-like n=1 Tax=Leptopilina boulardi TaxID=63433 RepID=UPI0021F622A1|nr:cytochrome b-c1 complex subunit 6, mitochondrial-like [Leptopilina boulardi]